MTKKTMQQEGLQDRLGEVLEPSWTDLEAILAELEAILGRFEGGWRGQHRCFSLGFSILFEKSFFRIKMIIMRGLGAILGPLGPLLGASWADLGSSWAPKRAQEGAQDEPKTSPKRHDFFDDFLMRFWCDLGGSRSPNMIQDQCGEQQLGPPECATLIRLKQLASQLAEDFPSGTK